MALNEKQLKLVDDHEAAMIDLDNAMHFVQQSNYFVGEDGFSTFDLYGRLTVLSKAVDHVKYLTKKYMEAETFG